MSRLDEIEARTKPDYVSFIDSNDVDWLIARVRELEAALEEWQKCPNGTCGHCIEILTGVMNDEAFKED